MKYVRRVATSRWKQRKTNAPNKISANLMNWDFLYGQDRIITLRELRIHIHSLEYLRYLSYSLYVLLGSTEMLSQRFTT